MIHQDYEHEAQKDLLYLWESQLQLEFEFWARFEGRLPAEVIVIDKDKIHTNEPEQVNILPIPADSEKPLQP